MNFSLETFHIAQSLAIVLAIGSAAAFYRSFRENYLSVWLLGWIAFFGRSSIQPQSTHPDPLWSALSTALFGASVYLFVAGVFMYTQNVGRLRKLTPFGLVAAAAGAIQAYWGTLPYGLDWLVIGLFLLVTGSAANELVKFNRGRLMFGPWLLAASLVFLHVDRGVTVQMSWHFVLELALGLGMALMVLDETHQRARRLAVLNSISSSTVQAEELQPLMQETLEKLRQLFGAYASWIRFLDGDNARLAAEVGLSEKFVEQRRCIPLAGSLTDTAIALGHPTILSRRSLPQDLSQEGVISLLIAPVRGRNATIGAIFLAFQSGRTLTPDERKFLDSIARQVGVAGENLRLLEQIKRSQRRWVGTFDSIPDPMLVHDPDFRIMKANRALLEKVGATTEQVFQRTCGNVLPNVAGDDCPYCRDASAGDMPDPCFGGYSLVSTSTYAEPGQTRPCVVHVIKDVTEHRKTEERYQMLFEQMREAVFVSTPDGRLLDCNDALVEMFGFSSKQELFKVDIAELYEDPDMRSQIAGVMQERGFLRNHEVRLKRRDGSTLIVLESSYGTRDAEGKVERYQGFLLDITAEKTAEEELKRRNRELFILNAVATAAAQSFDLEEILGDGLRHLVELFHADTGAVFLHDEPKGVLRRVAGHGHVTEIGRALPVIEIPAQLLDLIRDQRIDVITPDHIALLPAFLRDFIEAEGLKTWIWIVLWAHEKPIGVLGISCRSQCVFTESDRTLMVSVGRQLATAVDRTHLYQETRRAYEDLRQTQEQLLQSEKMSAVGQLISGVAHELNNPLTAILGYAQLLEQEGLEDRERDYVQKLYKQAQRTQKIVQNLLSFARQRKPAKQLVDVGRVLEETVSLRDYDMRLNDIDLLIHCDHGLPPVVADAHQLEQVFLNIVNNAMDAMLEGKKGGCLKVDAYRQGANVVARIHDSGAGIREVTRVFDPFYTTKAVGKGTGLGLSICYGIVKEHGGEIRASNHPSGGAVFEIHLPVAADVEVDSAPQNMRQKVALHGRVLIVDDEEAVVDFESRVLTGAGAEVRTLRSGAEAVHLLENEEFDVILLDGKMPGGWSGPEIYRWAERHRPALTRRMILAHSHLEDASLSGFLRETGIITIVKPFSVAELLGAVQSVLARARAQAAGAR